MHETLPVRKEEGGEASGPLLDRLIYSSRFQNEGFTRKTNAYIETVKTNTFFSRRIRRMFRNSAILRILFFFQKIGIFIGNSLVIFRQGKGGAYGVCSPAGLSLA